MIISLKERIANILKETPLPKARDVMDESRRLASEITIGRTKFMDKYAPLYQRGADHVPCPHRHEHLEGDGQGA